MLLTNFYKIIEGILDYMTFYRKMTQKQLKLERMSWITRGILVSMGVRNTFAKARKMQII